MQGDMHRLEADLHAARTDASLATGSFLAPPVYMPAQTPGAPLYNPPLGQPPSMSSPAPAPAPAPAAEPAK